MPRRAVPQLGHPLIDRQHRRIERLARDLAQAARSGRGERAALGLLLRATIRHFASEERLMARCGYPDRDGHRGLHAGVIESMRRLADQLRRGLPLHPKQTAGIDDWLAHHVSEADRNLVAALTPGDPHRPARNSRGERPAQARKRCEK